MKVNATVEQVNQGIRELGEAGAEVSINDDQTSGEVSVKGVRASFTFNDGTLTVNVLDKPWLVSVEYVESEIRGYFE